MTVTTRFAPPFIAKIESETRFNVPNALSKTIVAWLFVKIASAKVIVLFRVPVATKSVAYANASRKEVNPSYGLILSVVVVTIKERSSEISVIAPIV